MRSLFVDTNILARYLLGDVLEHFTKVNMIFEQAAESKLKLYFVPEVIIELNYVLNKIYEKQKDEVVTALKDLLNLQILQSDQKDALLAALDIYSNNSISFEDSYYIAYSLLNNLEFFSFDSKANKVFNNYSK